MKGLFIKSALLSLLLGVGVYAYSSLPDVLILRRSNPKTTALMELRAEEYRQQGRKAVKQQIWVPYQAISEHLKRAIIISEDASFFSHKGVDVYELKESLKEDLEQGSFKRGGSTITMQLARNLYLDPSKSPIRKLKEVVITWQLEMALTKQRIFELYLNLVEWGPGIYGAEAASRRFFSRPASDLAPVEAATLAAMLPNPRNPREKGLLYRRNLILTRLFQVGHISEAEFNQTKGLPLFQRGESIPSVTSAEEPALDDGEAFQAGSRELSLD